MGNNVLERESSISLPNISCFPFVSMSLSNGMPRNFFFYAVYLAQEYLQFSWSDMYSSKLISVNKLTSMCFVIPQFGFSDGHTQTLHTTRRKTGYPICRILSRKLN